MKEGIEYFPLDTALDDKFRLIEAEFGLTGFAVVVKLFQRIYGERGYYGELQDEVALLFAAECKVGGSVVSEIITASIKRGIFDKTLYDKYRVLTSRGIQKRYFEAVSRRKSVSVKKQYLLLPCAQLPKNAYILEENVDIFAKNVDISQQSRVKESKVNKTTTKRQEKIAPQNTGDSGGKTEPEKTEDEIVREKLPEPFYSYYTKRLKNWNEAKGRSLPPSYAVKWYEADLKKFGKEKLLETIEDAIEYDRTHNTFDVTELFKLAKKRSLEAVKDEGGEDDEHN